MKNTIITCGKSFFLLSLLFLASCVKQEEISSQTDTLSDFLVSIPGKDSCAIKQSIIRIHGDLGKYEQFFEKHDAQIGILSDGSKKDGEERISAYYKPPKSETKSSYSNLASAIRVNGFNLFSSLTPKDERLVKDMFGGNISFSVSGEDSATKATQDHYSLYSPAILRIAAPQYMPRTGNSPICYYQDFVVRWNADRNNENGVLIIVRWMGSMLFGKDYSFQVCHTVRVPDNGQTVLDESMFEGIPDTAYCHLFLVRGNLEDFEIDQIDYQLLTETHDLINFVLVRNIVKTSLL